MRSRLESEFERELDKFWKKKYYSIKSNLIFRYGRKPERRYTSEWDESRKEILDLYRKAVTERAWNNHLKHLIVYKSKNYKIPFHRKRGWGKELYNTIKGWLSSKVKRIYDNNSELHLDSKPHIYLFWKGDKCVYVGRTVKYDISGGGGKLDLRNWREANRLQIYFIDNKRNLPKAECLARDIFNPYQNEIKPSQPRYTSPCPIHEDLWFLDGMLKRLSKI